MFRRASVCKVLRPVLGCTEPELACAGRSSGRQAAKNTRGIIHGLHHRRSRPHCTVSDTVALWASDPDVPVTLI
jgi:hypothetical protein